jgi:hypothetical protein
MKNSRAIINLAIKGANCQLMKPRSTKVYSKGSMGFNLVNPEKMNTHPINIHNMPGTIFLIIIKLRKDA